MKSFRFLKNTTSRIAKKAFEISKNHNLLNPKDKNAQKIEKGRSMVEMLGVLAVIGVLSVGGILGYKYGITKWKANETVNELNLRAHDISFRMEKLIELNHTGEIEMEMGNVTRLGYPIMARMSPQYVDYFEMFLSDVPSDVCKELLKSQWQAPYSIFVDVTEYEASADICDQAEEVELAYEFYKDLSRKEDVPEETRHKIQRCKHENHCQCGTCNENTGLCEGYCMDSESCTKDYDDARWMVCCDRNYIVNGFCCASITEDGQCCNRNGQCCPPDKPLQDKNGTCHSCEETRAIEMNIPDTCTILCPSRYSDFLHKRCSLCGVAGTTVQNRPLIDNKGYCHSCDENTIIDIGWVSSVNNSRIACTGTCPNRQILKDSHWKCRISCSGDTPLLATDANCYSCEDTEHTIYNDDLTDTCENLCKNRKTEGDYCVADCLSDKPLKDKYGACHSCKDETALELSDPNTCTSLCPTRYLDLHNRCSLCGVAGSTVQHKPLINNKGYCYSCEEENSIDLGWDLSVANSHIACTGRCPNRQILKDAYWKCCLSCSGDKPLLATDGKCYPCEDTTHTIPTSHLPDTCENLCKNRKTEGDYCVADCLSDKPLKDKYGACHSCDDPNPIELLNPDDCSDVCKKRYLNNAHHKKCIACGVEGTTVANKPIWDWHGNCYSCEESGCISGGGEAVAQEATAARCSSACPNRIKKGEYCCQACTNEKPLRATNNLCYGCNDAQNITLASGSDCETLCPNREEKEGNCVRKNCTVGYFEGSNGTCYSCLITTPIAVADEESCKSCLNRIYQDGMCIDTGAE